MSILRTIRVPSPSMLVAFIALFVVLGGTAYAIAGANTVGSSAVIDNSLQSVDIHNGTIAAVDFVAFSYTQPVLGNGWNLGALTTVPGHGKDAMGFVHLRGQVLGGTL